MFQPSVGLIASHCTIYGMPWWYLVLTLEGPPALVTQQSVKGDLNFSKDYHDNTRIQID
jgi:hypothetical protein